jgi:hypothetical protein
VLVRAGLALAVALRRGLRSGELCADRRAPRAIDCRERAGIDLAVDAEPVAAPADRARQDLVGVVDAGEVVTVVVVGGAPASSVELGARAAVAQQRRGGGDRVERRRRAAAPRRR